MLGGVVYRSKTSKMLAIFISQFSFNGQNSNFTKLECIVFQLFCKKHCLGGELTPLPLIVTISQIQPVYFYGIPKCVIMSVTQQAHFC